MLRTNKKKISRNSHCFWDGVWFFFFFLFFNFSFFFALLILLFFFFYRSLSLIFDACLSVLFYNRKA